MSLELIVGPMFSGKTSLLISKVEVFSLTGKKCVIVRSSTDTRTQTVKTHRNLVYEGEVITLDSFTNTSMLDDYDVIGIDEGHFFDPFDLLSFVDKFLKKGTVIFIAMLKSTFKREPFSSMEWVYARSTDIIVRKAVCEICKQYNATNTKRRTDVTDNVLVGGKELYYPCCDKCWKE